MTGVQTCALPILNRSKDRKEAGCFWHTCIFSWVCTRYTHLLPTSVGALRICAPHPSTHTLTHTHTHAGVDTALLCGLPPAELPARAGGNDILCPLVQGQEEPCRLLQGDPSCALTPRSWAEVRHPQEPRPELRVQQLWAPATSLPSTCPWGPAGVSDHPPTLHTHLPAPGGPWAGGRLRVVAEKS